MTAEHSSEEGGEGLVAHIAIAGLPWSLGPEEGGVTEIEGRGQVIATADDLDAAFIVAAVNALPGLLAERDDLRGRLAAVEALAEEWEVLADYVNDPDSTADQRARARAGVIAAKQLPCRHPRTRGRPVTDRPEAAWIAWGIERAQKHANTTSEDGEQR